MSAAACLLLLLAVTAASAETFDGVGYKTWIRSGDVYSTDGKLLNPKGLGFGQLTDENGDGIWSLVRLFISETVCLDDSGLLWGPPSRLARSRTTTTYAAACLLSACCLLRASGVVQHARYPTGPTC